MPVEKTMKDILEDFAHPDKATIVDNSINGKCSKCGECCTNILPVSQKELETIAEYVIEHNIKPQTQMLVMQNRLACPYYDGKKCLIYEVRPLICSEFYCYKKPDIEMAMKFNKEERIVINMWSFAKDIEKRHGGCYD